MESPTVNIEIATIKHSLIKLSCNNIHINNGRDNDTIVTLNIGIKQLYKKSENGIFKRVFIILNLIEKAKMLIKTCTTKTEYGGSPNNKHI